MNTIKYIFSFSNPNMTSNFRICFTLAITFLIWGLLLWNHFNGGVPSHHILADEELPSVSNWWGAILLPVLTWILLFRIDRRINMLKEKTSTSISFRKAVYGFTGALLFGSLLSLFFFLKQTDICGYMILSLVPVSLFIPIYRSEYLLGFVLGMTYSFGAVLPTGIGLIFIVIAFIIYIGLRAIITLLKPKDTV
jgi:hypothetical protein